DVLDYTAGEAELGKPVGHDLLEGHATLPLLLADLPERLPDGIPLAAEQVAEAVAAVRASSGPEKALAAARKHAESARGHLGGLPEGPVREGLERLTAYVVERK